MKSLFILILLLITAFFNSCGSDDSGKGAQDNQAQVNQPESEKTPSVENNQAQLVAKESERPECKTEGHLIYVLDKKEFQSCKGKDWVAIEITNKTEVTNNNITNVYTEVIPDYVDAAGKNYVVMTNVQRSRIAKSCPSGYAIATDDQINALIGTDFFTAMNQGKLLYRYIYTASNRIFKTDTTLIYGAGYTPSPFYEAAAGIVCVQK